jgi:hypothetical protein
MRLLRECLVGLLVLLTALSSSVHAQNRHVVPPADIAAVVDAYVSSQNADRAAIRDVLERPEVRDVATRIGIDLDQVTAAIGTLSGPDLVGAASAARQINDLTLVGGASSVTLSTTTIIIILLALILIIVAVK